MTLLLRRVPVGLGFSKCDKTDTIVNTHGWWNSIKLLNVKKGRKYDNNNNNNKTNKQPNKHTKNKTKLKFEII